MDSNLPRKKYSLSLGRFIDSDSDISSLNHGFLQNSNVNRNHSLDRGLSSTIPLQTPQQNPDASRLLNSFQPHQSLLRNSATQMSASSSRSVNVLPTTMENVTGLSPIIPLQTPQQNPVTSRLLNSFQPHPSLLPNSTTEMSASSSRSVNLLQTPMENVTGLSPVIPLPTPQQNPAASRLLNSFQPHQPLLPNSATEMSASSSRSVNLLQTPMENVTGLSPIIPLQTPQQNPAASRLLNSFQPRQSLVPNSATDMSATSSKSVNLLQTPMEYVAGSNDLGKSVPELYSLLQNPAKQLYAGSNFVNQMQTPVENLGCSQLPNNFAPKQVYKGSDSPNHFSSPSQLFPNNVNENLSGTRVPKKLPSEQLPKKPIDPPSQKTSEAVNEILTAKDDYSLSFLLEKGRNYCTMDVNEVEQTTDKVSEEENSMGVQLIVEPSSEAINQREKGSLKIIDLLEQNLPKCPSQRRKEGDDQRKRELQVASPGTPSLLATALINRSDENRQERLNTPVQSSVSPTTATRGTGGPMKSRARTFPVKLYGETSHGSSSNRRFIWNRRYGGIPSATPPYHRVSRLSRSSSTLGFNSNWQTTPSGYNPESESQKWQHMSGSSNVEGVGDQQLSSPFRGQHNQSFQTTPSSLLAPTKETAKHAPLSAAEIVANARMKSTTQSQINSSTSQNQQPKQPLSANPSFFREVQKRGYDINESYNEPNSSGNSFAGNMVNSKLIHAPVTFDTGNKTKQVDYHAVENLRTKIDASNAASLELGQKEFERMVNWPEHHLMGTDRFGFDV